MKKIIYYVVYKFHDGWGSCTVDVDRPIIIYKDLEKLRETIMKNKGVENIIIISWKELKG